ncbi:hypothetical protein SK355_07760 [Candidatus Fukatsuia symbiotica]|uniref:PEGA domain-containing protein n=1 Tax=Candidatus Fukatsuia symbiotica TaxID=1878942 RepID=A0A2U8I6T3_9GAMM|nr:hypothetical protein [Candidatus Fukatsuia symbiotica]AWK14807.1 hypothetical protein CCS41_10520 [Candidatus Fukatsuia symbiotica]MEA9445144.1 hypothetical protein [Candidatus Fukatsuia symbiotica]
MKKWSILAMVSAVMLSGCATIVGKDTQLVQVNSDPAGAHFAIKDETGQLVAQGTTPQGVTLEKSDGSYFGKRNYQITFSKDKYQPTTLPIRASVNGWYIGSNVLFGGLIGWLVVDPFHGGMYTLRPKETKPAMVPSAH